MMYTTNIKYILLYTILGTNLTASVKWGENSLGWIEKKKKHHTTVSGFLI